MKIKKRFYAVMTIIAMVLVCFQVNARGIADVSGQITTETRFAASNVNSALLLSADDRSVGDMQILNEVLQPSSMGIEIPKINPDRVIDINDKLLSEYAGYQEFYDELADHGIPEEVAAKITMSQYRQIESTWPLSGEFRTTALELYPALKEENISSWKIGDYQNFVKEENINDIRKRFTEDQLEELQERNILIEDTFYLFKEYHNADTILSQTNATLKAVLEDYYAFIFDYTLGTGALDQWYSVHEDEDVELMSSPTYTLPAKAKGYYTWVDFPKYGADYFHNNVLTTWHMQNVQAYRTLLTQCDIYGQLYTTSKTLYCSNMYGTFSRSQGGAHEGIDFAYGGKIALYCPVEGISLTIPTTNKNYSHQLSIYDSNCSSGAKTYSFLHLSEKSTASSFEVADRFGVQGDKGNATGIHLHFEVHNGRSINLSSESDQVVGSASPYNLTEYIGEAQLPPGV